MKMYLIFFNSLFAFFLFSCSNGNTNEHKTTRYQPQTLFDSTEKKGNFDSLLADASRDTVLDFSSELTANPSFMVIYEHSSAYLDDVIRFLSKRKFSSMQAAVCIYGMQKLSVEDYVRLCRLYLQLYNDHKIAERMLEEAILPNFLESKIISENYKNPDVISLLREIKNNGSISPEFRRLVEGILVGEYLDPP